MHKLSSFGRHMWKNLCLLLRRHKPTVARTQHKLSIQKNNSTYSSKAFSTTARNFGLILANATSSSWYETAVAFSLDSAVIPSASANLAFLFAIPHSLLHFGASCSYPAGFEAERPQCTDWRIRPHGHVKESSDWHGSCSAQVEGAWHGRVQGWCAGRLLFC